MTESQTDQQSNDLAVNSASAKKKWGPIEKATWLSKQKVQRSYHDEVLTKIKALPSHFTIEQYGGLSYDEDRYPLYAIKSAHWDNQKATILITGGVHGYETSGVHGALKFIEAQAINYTAEFNFVVLPCISPWGYETVNRWNPKAVDPNRSFYADSPAEESAAAMLYLAQLKCDLLAHFDLHETTDSDNTEFRPALAARDAVEHTNWNIPDGFYLVGDAQNPVDDFQKAIIQSVQQVTHIAPADHQGRIIGEKLAQFGVINYEAKKLGLCGGLSNSRYTTTTEVYPDSAKVTDEDCVMAQVAAIVGGLEYIKQVS